MYEAKAAGKGQYRRFRPDMHVRSLARLGEETALRRAVEEQQLIVHYQPMVGLDGGAIVGTEALVRWQHPERGLLTLAEFAPVAESTGLIVPIGDRVLSEACRQTKRWQDASPAGPALSVSVNLSGRQFQQPGLVEPGGRSAGPLRAGAALPGSRDDRERADAGHRGDPANGRSTTRRGRPGGAIDDFGTGESSLDCLRRFPIDIVKIDQSFIDGVATGTDESRLAQGIVNLARTLQYQIVAEGVDYAEQAAALRSFGCDLGQGDYFARPGAPEQLAELLVHGTLRQATPLAS